MMHRARFVLVAAALMVGGTIAAQPTASATAKISCAQAKGTWSFSPSLPRDGTSAKVTPVSTIAGSLGGCTGGGVTSGTIKFSSPKSKNGVNCATFKRYDTVRVTGQLTVTWNTKATSKATLSLSKVKGHATQRTVLGTVNRGLFAGYRVSGLVGYTLPKGACTSNGLKSVSFKNLRPFVLAPTGPSR